MEKMGKTKFNVKQYGAFHLVRTHLGVRGGGGVKPPTHIHYVLHAKRAWVGPDYEIACKIAYVLSGRPLLTCLHDVQLFEKI